MKRTKIVVLDGYTLNPGDLSWKSLETLGECSFHDRTPPQLVIERAAGADVLLTNKAMLPREIIMGLPELKYIGVLATGYNVVDISAAKERGILVTNVPAYSTLSVAQMTFSLILELTQHVGHHAQTVREGRWCSSKDFCYWDYPLVELNGLTLGVVGYGNIGQSVARIGRSFGMTVMVCSAHLKESNPDIELADLDTLFSRSDIVTLHCPLTDESRGMVNAARLARMKNTAFLINTSRGPLVVEQDLADALNAGRIAGAGLEVMVLEPPSLQNPLLKARNCFITPHIAWATQAARRRLMESAIDNVRSFLLGRPKNVVNQ